jgi:hypothetical protein
MQQPTLKPVAPRPRRHAFYAVTQLSQRDDAEKDAILVSRLHPADQAWIRTRLHPFRNHIRVQKKVHSRIFRGRALSRRALRFDPRNGDPAKNSAKLPARMVFRCHSSAPTTTAAVRPFRVMVCGPSDMARSMISLNFALASAAVQFCAPIPAPFQSRGHDSHCSHPEGMRQGTRSNTQ